MGFYRATKGGLFGPLPAFGCSAELALQLGLHLTQVFTVPSQLGMEAFVEDAHHHPGLADAGGGAFFGAVDCVKSQIPSGALS